jgi:RNA polymerase sigma-70 factor (ECF subfamily)
VVVADGGGLVTAARRPIAGAERVAGFLLAGLRPMDFEMRAVCLNGSPAARLDVGGALDTAVSVLVEHGRITRIYAVRNPQKLAGLDGVAAVTRS